MIKDQDGNGFLLRCKKHGYTPNSIQVDVTPDLMKPNERARTYICIDCLLNIAKEAGAVMTIEEAPLPSEVN